MLGFLCAFLFAHFLGFLPLMQICELTKYSTAGDDACILAKSWSTRCVLCLFLSLGCGLVLPKVAVICMYCLIYKIIKKARATNRALSTALSDAAEPMTEGKRSDKEKKMKSERESFPWSIIIILALNVASAIPWLVLVGAPELFYRRGSSLITLYIDILYSTLLLAMASSPISYLFTTKAVRDTFFSSVRRSLRCRSY